MFRLFLSLLHLIVFLLWMPSIVLGERIYDYDRSSAKYADVWESLEDIARDLESLKSGMKIPQADHVDVTLTDNQEFPAPLVLSDSSDLMEDKTNEKPQHLARLGTVKEEGGLGFYILPFVGVQSSDNFEWTSFGGVFEIETKSGLTSGIQIGYDWEYVFMDLQFSYYKNDIKSIDLPLDIIGEANGLAFHISSGTRFKFSESFAGILGFGVGGVNQEISFTMATIPQSEKDFLLSSHLFAGLEFRPLENLVLGLRYRWLSVAEMEVFESRDFHLWELTAGYNL